MTDQKVEAVQYIEALTPLVWPVIACFVLVGLFPIIKAIMLSRSFSVKVGDMEVSVQDVTEQLNARIEDLQKQVVTLREQAPSGLGSPKAAAEVQVPSAPRKVVLWVDDKPKNNAFEITQLKDWGIDVLTCQSTDAAVDLVQGNPDVAAIISDMGRQEGIHYRSRAGLDLLGKLKERDIKMPFLIYSTAKYAARYTQEVIELGGSRATSSQVELLQWVRQTLGLPLP